MKLIGKQRFLRVCMHLGMGSILLNHLEQAFERCEDQECKALMRQYIRGLKTVVAGLREEFK